MTEIPEDIQAAVHRAISDLKGRADSIEEDGDAALADAFTRAMLAERRRCMRKVNEEANGVTDEAVLIYALQVQRAIAEEK